MSLAAASRRCARRMLALSARLGRDKRGNVLMIVGLSIIPLTFSAGMAIDYSRAMRLQTKLNAAADAAALSAVTRPMMNQSSAIACSTAKNMFVGQSTSLAGLTINANDPAQLAITVTDSATPGSAGTTTTCSSSSTATAASYSRSATVSYHATSQNAFGGILGLATLPIHGTSTAYSAVAPNIDFYVMIDTSQSMLLPATSAGLATMTAATNGCAFACHQSSTSASDPGHTPLVNGRYWDNYQVARNAGIVLRTDLVAGAVQDLTTLASTTSQSNHAVYRMGLSDFDYMYRQLWPTAAIGGFNVDSNLSTVSSHVGDAQVAIYCTNNQRICGTGDNDTDSNYTAALTGAAATMPLASGYGTNNAGDTPEAMLFIITDGMRDELYSGSRYLGPIPASLCTTIKNRGIRIAILDTQYLPASASDSWSITNVKTPYLSPTDRITPALTACASPGLFYQVTTDGDISAALATLFQKAVASARLTQ
ncbi:pilus assembly protein [Sphingomonas oligophenolica]|uniref:Pilus assembly protein TadG-related protein n=1 Tax=Sphingomonas oligophenolica TaxID=301154 RepID=A0ABU9Y3W4_9SPHN